MSGPLIFVSRSRVRPGKREQYESHLKAATEMVESEEPRVIAFNSWASEDGAEVSTMQVHPDAESLDLHFKLFAERLADQVFQALDTYEIDIYGKPSDTALAFLGQYQDIRVRVLPAHEGGFLRPQPL